MKRGVGRWWILLIVLGAMWSCASARAGELFPQNVPPTVKITRPPQGRLYTFGSQIRLEAAASDPDGSVVRVDFVASDRFMGERIVATVTNAPYSQLWFDELHTYVSYTLTARATDSSGVVSTSAPVTIFVWQDIYPPVVALTSPLNESIHRPARSIVLSAIAGTVDDSELPMDFYSGSDFIGSALSSGPVTDPTGQFRWGIGYTMLWTNAPPGDHHVTARLLDGSYQEGVSPPIKLTIADLTLGTPRMLASQQFVVTVRGAVTGAPVVLFNATDLAWWIPMATNIPLTSQFEFNIAPTGHVSSQFLRAWSER